MSLILWTLAIAIVTALACSICGVFLVVKREAFVSEGLSHAVLPGIIVAFLIFQDRSSPLLILAAGLSGLLMVWLVNLICRFKRVEQDAALGIVFSGLFSIGIILSNLKLRNTHFHAHCIIDGNLASAPLNRFEVGGIDLGPKAFVMMSSLLVMLVVFIWTNFKSLKLVSFDESLAYVLGYRPAVIRFAWLALVSIVTVAAFETAGTILVVALMIAPAAAANLLTTNLVRMIWTSAILGSVAAGIGIGVGIKIDVAPAGPIASIAGMLFLLAVLFSPKSGVLAIWRRRKQQRQKLLQQLILQLVESGADAKKLEDNQEFRNWLASRIAAPTRHINSALRSLL